MKTKKIMQHLIGKTYEEVVPLLVVQSGEGDCCGWSAYDVEDFVKPLEFSSSAKLVDVVEIDYSDDYSSRVVVNFLFDIGEKSGVILGYDLRAGSGSGWSYGAYCQLLLGDEEVSCANW